MSKYKGKPKSVKLAKTLVALKSEADDELVRIGQEFYEARTDADFTHEMLRDITGISISTIHHLEHGKGIGMKNYIILLGALGLKLD